jgi:Flp pilus assembly CpaE family ATPase
MRASLTPRFCEQLLALLGERFRYVVLDSGADLLGPEGAPTRTALGLAGQVLLVAGGDLVGLWRARTALGMLEKEIGIARERLALVVNRYDRRHHHARREIEWALGMPATAVIPHDHAAAQRALAEQRPLVLHGQGKAAGALLDLAERLHGAGLGLPPERPESGRGWLGRLLPLRTRTAGAAKAKEGMVSGSHAAGVR